MRVMLAFLVLTGVVWGQVFTRIAEITDGKDNYLTVTKSSSGSILIELCPLDSETESTVSLSPGQTQKLIEIIRSAPAVKRQLQRNQDATVGTITRGNSSASVLVAGPTIALCVTQGRLNRFYYLTPTSTNKLVAALAKASGSKAPKPVAEPVQPKMPDAPSYPTR